MSEILETMARAACMSVGVDPDARIGAKMAPAAWRIWRSDIVAALAVAAEAGYVLVPIEPTKDMLRAASKAMSPERRPTPERVSVREKHAIRWRAMVAAAQSNCPSKAASEEGK